MYLHHILNRNQNELIYKVYQSQKNRPVKGDWSEVVKEDLKIFELDEYDDMKIASVSKEQWKQRVKTAMEAISLLSLIHI